LQASLVRQPGRKVDYLPASTQTFLELTDEIRCSDAEGLAPQAQFGNVKPPLAAFTLADEGLCRV
jgi:hypothetical protein